MLSNSPSLAEARFIEFLTKAYLTATDRADDYAKGLKKIEQDLHNNIAHEEHAIYLFAPAILKLRNDLLEWLIIFPEIHRVQLIETLTHRYQDFLQIEMMIDPVTLHECIVSKITDITARLVVILNFSARVLHSSMERFQPIHFPLPLFIKPETLMKELYCPLIYRTLSQSYLIKIHCPPHGLDQALKNTPEVFPQMSKDFEELKHQLNLEHDTAHKKLKLQLSNDLEELVDGVFESIALHQYPAALKQIAKFYTIWVESNALANYFSPVTAHVYSMLASYALYALSMQLAWITHYSSSMAFGFTLINIYVGIESISPLFLFTQSFFKYSKQNNRHFSRYRRAIRY